MRQARAYRNGVYAGVLTETDDRKYEFAYDPAYLADPDNPAISTTLPKRTEKYSSDHLFPFFYHMLSEGANREVQSRLLKIDEKDHFGLLVATARYDTPGAVTVRPFTR